MKIKKGFSLVEIVVMVSVVFVFMFIVWQIYVLYIKIASSNPDNFQASFIAEEGIEAVKFMRDDSWTDNIAPLVSGTAYTLVFDGSSWMVTTDVIFVSNKFDRRIYFEDVSRNFMGNIDSLGDPDQNTKKVVVEVSWQKDFSTTTRTITTYVSNIFNN